jgi:hypothetical protein
MADLDAGFRRYDGLGGGLLGNGLLLHGPNSGFPEALLDKKPPAVTSSDTNP